MKHGDFKRWRKSLGLSQKDAAEALGLKRRVLQYYEKGVRDGKKVKIPKAVRLACYALSVGVEDYDGPGRKRGTDNGNKPPAKPAGTAKPAAGKDDLKGAARTAKSARPAPVVVNGSGAKPPTADKPPPSAAVKPKAAVGKPVEKSVAARPKRNAA